MAFTWNGEREDNFDIYLKLVGSSEVRRLTSDPAPDLAPRWSPNGQEIAFIRGGTDRSTLHIVSPLGGTERKVSDFAVARRTRLVPRWSLDRGGASTGGAVEPRGRRRHLSHSSGRR